MSNHDRKMLDRLVRRFPRRTFKCTNGFVVCDDALSFLSQLPDEIADIVFLDPPFNLSKIYGTDGREGDRQELPLYMSYMERVLQRAAAVLKPGGALYLYHIPQHAYRFAAFLDHYLSFRHWIALSMKNGFVRGDRLYPAHYALLFFTKGKPSRLVRPKIPTPRCRHCAKLTKDYGGYKEFVKDGVNLSDFWEDTYPLRHKKHKTRLANELHPTIPLRAIQISGSAGDLLIDPFAGSGTALIQARKQGLQFIGCDKYRPYCKLSISRLRQIEREGHGGIRNPRKSSSG